MPPRHCILVAEDDHDVRELIRTRLTALGHDVHTARNGAEALARITSVKPAAMVLDINMPVVDGFGVLEELRTRGCLFPVLVLTARHAADDVRRAVSLGAKDYLTKPFSEAQLQARVARLLRAPAAVPPTSALVGD
ncbi:response regulator [Phenylobacterium sp.]|uniref:response regulator transcription factor n=1 Tax=Phenylobacterium sp. TaxID=1871053 RepID=UPI0025ECEA64|nr:response regulator [Phenylobacterium sp.]